MKAQVKGNIYEQYDFKGYIEPGVHEAMVIGAREQMSKNNNPMLVIDFGLEGQDGGVCVRHYVPMTFQPAIDQFVRALLPDRIEKWEESNETDFGEIEPKEIIGYTCKVKIIIEPYQGQNRLKIDELMPL